MGYLLVEGISSIASTGNEIGGVVVSEVLKVTGGVKSEIVGQNEGRGSISVRVSHVEKVQRGSVSRAENSSINSQNPISSSV